MPIPGAATLHLPAGEVAITLHTYAVGAASGGGLPIPELGVSIDPPPGVADPTSSRTSAPPPASTMTSAAGCGSPTFRPKGNYRIRADGKGQCVHPSRGWPSDTDRRWVGCHGCSGALLAVSIADLVISMIWLSRRRSAASVPNPPGMVSDDFAPDPDAGPTVTPASQPMGAYTRPDEGVRIEQIKHLAALWIPVHHSAGVRSRRNAGCSTGAEPGWSRSRPPRLRRHRRPG